MSESKIEYVANQVKEVEVFIQENEDSYEDLRAQVEEKLDAIRAYAEENEVPFMMDADELIERNREESYEEEPSSSSYYEEESEYEDEDNEEQELEDEEEEK